TEDGLVTARLQSDAIRVMCCVLLRVGALVAAPRVHPLNEDAAAVAASAIVCEPDLKIAALDQERFSARVVQCILRNCMHHQVATFRIGIFIVDLPARRARGVPQFYSDVKGACSVAATRIWGGVRLSSDADS